MGEICIKPHKLHGTVQAPPSKSMAHRALICAALSATPCTVQGISDSKDMEATLACLKALGYSMQRNGDTVSSSVGRRDVQKAVLDCGESGSTLRFMIPVAAALGVVTEFTGKGRLPQRPIGPYENAFSGKGVTIETEDGHLPMRIMGKLEDGTFNIPGDISSQFITGLLLAAPLVQNDMEIILTTPLESEPYVDLTIDVLKAFHADIRKTGNGYFVRKGQTLRNIHYTVEGDYSQAAFFLAGGAIQGCATVSNLNRDSKQGDRAIVNLLRQFGADIQQEGDTVTCRHRKLHGINIDASQIPDLVPVLAVTGAYASGTTRIYHATRLRLKESDRLAATKDMLQKLGADIETTDDGLLIQGKNILHGGRCGAWNDHRIAMAGAIAGMCSETGAIIEGYECVKKSYPGFFDDLLELGGD